MYILGLDIGTTGIKSIVFDENWDPVGYGFQECNVLHHQPNWNEQDAEHIWSIAKDVIKASTANCKNRVGALSVSVQGDAVVAIDQNRKAICPVQLGIDYRGRAEAELCRETFGDYELFRKTGMRSHPLNAFVKMLHIRRVTPGIYEQADKLVTYSDFILAKLGSDSVCIDYTMATRAMCLDLKSLLWDEQILKAFDFDLNRLAIPVPPGSIVGTVPKSLSQKLGLADACLIVAGGHDQACAELGAGLLQSGIALDSHGTAEVLSTVFDKAYTNQKMYESYYPCSAYMKQGMYYSFALLHVGGILLKWFTETYCPDLAAQALSQGISPYELVTASMPSSPSPLLVIPYLNGSGTPSCNLDAKGAILGLTLSNTRQETARAMIESLTFEARLNFETMAACGFPIKEVRCVGGGAKSALGLQLKADVWNTPIVTMKYKESACLGAAILAAKGAGIFNTFEEAVSQLVKIERCFEPDTKTSAFYADRYQEYHHWANLILNEYGGSLT